MSHSLITASNLGFSYQADNGDVEVIKDINLNVAKGSFLSIIGPSGCGKTSLLRLIAGLEKPTDGDLEVGTQNSAFVFQQPALFPWASVKGNVAKPLKLMQAGQINQKVDSVLELVGLSEFESKYPHQLSGGMQQRVSIARALAMEPDLLLMDEPFGALDEMTREAMNLELHKVWSSTKKTVCFVTHSISEAAFLSTDILVLSSRPGQIIKQIKSPLSKQKDTRMYDSSEFKDLVSYIRAALK